jgi:hypothetical protein
LYGVKVPGRAIAMPHWIGKYYFFIASSLPLALKVVLVAAVSLSLPSPAIPSRVFVALPHVVIPHCSLLALFRESGRVHRGPYEVRLMLYNAVTRSVEHPPSIHETLVSDTCLSA